MPPHTTTVHHHRKTPCPPLVPLMPLRTPNGFFPRNELLNLPAMRASVFYCAAAWFPGPGILEWKTRSGVVDRMRRGNFTRRRMRSGVVDRMRHGDFTRRISRCGLFDWLELQPATLT